MAKPPARRTAPRIAVVDGQPTTTSRDIAETFGKRHDHVLERIRKLDCSPEFRVPNFRETVSERPNPSGGAPIPSVEYRITRDGFAFLCMGFTGAKAAAWKERYINTFNRLAEKVATRTQPARALPPPAAPRTKPAPLLALPAPRSLPADMLAAIDARTGQIVGSAYTEVRQWLIDQVRSGCIKPDGSAAPNFANTLAGADFAAFSTRYASKHLEHGLFLLNYLHQHSGELAQMVRAKQQDMADQAKDTA